MSWHNSRQINARSCDPDVHTLVRDTVRTFRMRGEKIPHAMEQTAVALDTTTRRVRSIYYGGLLSLPVHLSARIKSAYLRHLDAEAIVLEQRAEALRAKRRQYETRCQESFDFGGARCAGDSRFGARNGVAR